MRLHSIPYSTNVERVALALAHKGLAVEHVVHDPGDRAALRALSGQELTPVLELDDGQVLHDSPAILLALESLAPAPPLLPSDAARREEVLVFCDWFNRVWKLAPNALTDTHVHKRGLSPHSHAGALRESVDRFEALLTGRDFLLGAEMTLADVTAFPFVKYPVLGLAEDDVDPFHRVLVEGMAVDPVRHRAVVKWVRRLDALPRA